MKLHVEVTAEDIAAGIKQRSDSCPIARALCRLADVETADVYDMIAVYTPGGGCLGARTPKEACQFIDRFDAGKAVEPFSFDIEVEVKPPVDDDDDDDEPDEDLGDEDGSL